VHNTRFAPKLRKMSVVTFPNSIERLSHVFFCSLAKRRAFRILWVDLHILRSGKQIFAYDRFCLNITLLLFLIAFR